jgi:hypothetical protein
MAHTKEEIEAAEDFVNIEIKGYDYEWNDCKRSFLAGIDYQKSQSYSREDLFSFASFVMKGNHQISETNEELFKKWRN